MVMTPQGQAQNRKRQQHKLNLDINCYIHVHKYCQLKVDNTVKEAFKCGKRREALVDGLGQAIWLVLAWNYKPTGRSVLRFCRQRTEAHFGIMMHNP